MTDFSPTVRISGVPVETKERDDPEAVLRKTIKLLYQETLHRIWFSKCFWLTKCTTKCFFVMPIKGLLNY